MTNAMPYKIYQPLYYFDAIWNLTEKSKDMYKSFDIGHQMIAQVKIKKVDIFFYSC